MKKLIYIDGQSWGERELAQLIRRRMLTKGNKNKKKYDRESDKKSVRELYKDI